MDEMIAGTDIGFQSTPVIANGRIFGRRVFPQSESHGFNPRPLLLTGESRRGCRGRTPPARFNPRPLLLTGESGDRLASGCAY